MLVVLLIWGLGSIALVLGLLMRVYCLTSTYWSYGRYRITSAPVVLKESLIKPMPGSILASKLPKLPNPNPPNL